jgi:hypothetical protein
MEDDDAWEIRTFHLPLAFWEALWKLRCVLLFTERFSDLIYGMHRNRSLRQAFDLVDVYLKKSLEELDAVENR